MSDVAPAQVGDEGTDTVVGILGQEYRDCMITIDETVKQLVTAGRDMRAVQLHNRSVARLEEIHEILTVLYTWFVYHGDVLTQHGSTRLASLGFVPFNTASMSEQNGMSRLEAEYHFEIAMRRIGLKEEIEHWTLKGVFLAEIEYMLFVLGKLIEPDWIPVEVEVHIETCEEGAQDRCIPTGVKIAVWRRDQGKCVQCGSQERLEYDHVIPVCKGGSSTERNIQLLCEKCNRAKAAQIK